MGLLWVTNMVVALILIVVICDLTGGAEPSYTSLCDEYDVNGTGGPVQLFSASWVQDLR